LRSGAERCRDQSGLNKTLGGHVLAKVLVKLRILRISDREMAMGGRPGECWCPGDPPEEMNASIVWGDADDRTNKVHVGMGFELP